MDPYNPGRLLQRIDRLVAIGTALSAEHNLGRLLETILLGAKELTGADGGSLYLLDNRVLTFELIHTTSLGLHMGGTSGKPITFPAIPLDRPDGSPDLNKVVTRAVIEGRMINIGDAYAEAGYDFSGTRAFDANTGYHSQSMLTVPMQDHEEKIIGVLQLINAKEPVTEQTVPFSPADEGLVASLASQAAIALTRKRLIEGLELLLQSLVRLIATAIDDKSPHTGGHCRRVPAITVAIAKAVSADAGPIFGKVRFDAKQMAEIEMAAWLHDCGKITTPEFVVDKQTKLEALFDRIQLVDARLEVMRRDAEIARLRECLAENGVDPAPPAAGYLERLAQIAEAQEFLRHCNSGGSYIDEHARQKIEALGRQSVQLAGQDQPLLTADEIYNLCIPRGTLNPEERQIINNHIDASVRMLTSLPFPEHLQRVPEIAGGHHERMDGKGYPRGVPAGELSLQARILAIADVFEALTASDRVYRKPNTLSEALTIMARMGKEGHIDTDLFDLFLQREVYLDYARGNLKPEQIDKVDYPAIRQIFAVPA